MSSPYDVVQDFELEVAKYTGAPYCVAVNSCTMALTLAVAWHLTYRPDDNFLMGDTHMLSRPAVEIPSRTYVSVPMAIIHAGGRPTFRDEVWSGTYRLDPLPVWDSARLFTSGMYHGSHPCIFNGRMEKSNTTYWIDLPVDCSRGMVCVSFHASKTLGIEQGGAILHDNEDADQWFRMARFDGRIEGVTPKQQAEWGYFNTLGWHCYMSPSVAAQGLLRMHSLPRHNDALPNDEYPDLSTMEIFR